MKKHFFNLLLTAMLLLTGTMAGAQTFTVDNLEYKVTSETDKTVEVKARERMYDAVVIPATVEYQGNTYNVTSIGRSAFSGCTGLTSVEIPESVINIREHAFYNCTGLTSVEIPNSVISIGENAFYKCTGLTSIEIPEGVIIINSGAFMNCTALTSVTIPKSLKVMHGAFPGCENITTVNISDLAAYCNIEMGEYHLGNYESYTIDSYRGLPMFNFISSLSDEVYGGWTHTYSTPKDLVLNGEKIVDLVIPAGVNKITGHFFGSSVESISFEERDVENSSLTITSYSFAGMKNLKKVTLPDFDIRLGIATFIGCTSLEEITIGRDYEWAYDRNDPSLLYGGLPVEIEIFQGCTHLKKLTAKEGVTRIPDMFGTQFSFSKMYVNAHHITDILKIDTLIIPDLEITTNIQPLTIDYLNEAAWYGSSLDQKHDCNVLVAGEPVKEKSGELIIPQGTKRIFGGKISGMNITKVTLPNSITHIYGGAFKDCTKLSGINIPDNVTYIGAGAFENTAIYNNSKENFLYMDNWLVAYKSDNLGDIKITEGTKGIADRLFTDNKTLTGIELPNSITKINDEAFSGCSELKKITIPSSITSIGNSAFENCNNLEEVHINDVAAWCGIDFANNPLTYANKLYMNGKLVTELTIPDNVTRIKDFAFYGYTGLTSIVIPESVTSIGEYVFTYCTSLADIKLSSNIRSMNIRAFENTAWYNNCSDGLLYLSNWLMGYKGRLTQDSLIINEGTIGIADDIRFNGPRYVSLPKSLKHIGREAFLYSSYTFEANAMTPPSVSGTLTGYPSSCTLLVSISTGHLDAYLNDNNWSSFGTIIASNRIGDFEFRPATKKQTVEVYGYFGEGGKVKIPAKIEFEGETFTTTDICNEAFRENTAITSVKLPDCITRIEGSAFANCSALAEINIPSGIKNIEENTFCGCTALSGISIPNGVTEIGGHAFSNCTSLTEISIPQSVKHIGNNAFYDCSSLAKVNIPKYVETIEPETFYGCTALSEIDINYNVTDILDSAFQGCTSLTSIYIPNNVKNIGNSAFYKCSSLERVTIGSGIENVGSNVFRLCNNIKKVEVDCAEVGTWFNTASSIQEVVLGRNVRSISRRAFYNAKNTVLTSVTSLIPAEALFEVEDLVKDYNICTLYVQTGTKEAYEATADWKEFANIVEMDLTGVEEVKDKADENGVEIVYDLSGRRVETPSKGIYIVNGKKTLIK